MNTIVNYDINIYEKWLLIKDKYEETKEYSSDLLD